MDYPIPHASKQAWLRLNTTAQSTNPGLIFDRFIQQDWSQKPDKEAKKKALQEVITASAHADDILLIEINRRWETVALAAHAQFLNMQTDWRFLTGIGRKGPLEVGFTFNRYGFPVLPGSSVKGLARAGARLDLGFTDDLSAEANSDFLQIFGRAPQSSQDRAPAQSGRAIFFDAIPITTPKIILDILNPHFPDYYTDDPKNPRHAPTDHQNPKPVYFLTVAPGQIFRFAIGWCSLTQADLAIRQESLRLQARSAAWLKLGLESLGAGAKTSAGYGYFKEAILPTPRLKSMQKSTLTEISTTPAGPIQHRRGVIVAIRPDKQYGVLSDSEDGKEYCFSTKVVHQGKTPGKKAPVEFDLQDEKVIRVEAK